MQSKVKHHRRIVEELNKLYAAKNKDYGDSFGKSIEKFGMTAALVRIEDKWNRICNLMEQAHHEVLDESIEDTLLDMANYCIMSVIEMQRTKPQKEESEIKQYARMLYDAISASGQKMPWFHNAELQKAIMEVQFEKGAKQDAFYESRREAKEEEAVHRNINIALKGGEPE